MLSSSALVVLPAQSGAKLRKPANVSKAPANVSIATAKAVAKVDTLDPARPAIDHAVFDALLHQHVSNGLVDYAAFKNNAQFVRYLASLNAVDVKKFDEPEQIAFWLNVYNAYTIQLVASRGEELSIRNIDRTLGVFRLKGPWNEPFVKAAGRTLTLDDVEHRILRKEFSEPRVHFAMCFAAKGGPPLRKEAYSGVRLDEQLEDQAREFLLNSPTKNRVDVKAFTVYASPVLTRYRSDFGASPSALGAFLAQYFPLGSPEAKMLAPRVVRVRDGGGGPFGPPPDSARGDSGKRVRTASFFRIVETPFDWSLNIQPVRR
jgi:hypothetical protein